MGFHIENDVLLDFTYDKGEKRVKDIVVPDGVKVIDEKAFEGFLTIESVELPKGLKEIGKLAFHKCKNLKRINIPDGVEIIGMSAFSGCESLKRLTIPKSVTKIGAWAFNDMKSLKKIKIPNGITKLPSSIFSGCKSLEEVELHDNITSIGAHAFYGCGFTSIKLPEKLRSIEKYAFAYCKKLTDFVFPKNVKVVKENNFDNCLSLKTIVFPDNMKSVYTDFRYCDNLTSVTLPKSADELYINFSYCNNLESVEFKGIGSSWRFFIDKCPKLKTFPYTNGFKENFDLIFKNSGGIIVEEDDFSLQFLLTDYPMDEYHSNNNFIQLLKTDDLAEKENIFTEKIDPKGKIPLSIFLALAYKSEVAERYIKENLNECIRYLIVINDTTNIHRLIDLGYISKANVNNASLVAEEMNSEEFKKIFEEIV